MPKYTKKEQNKDVSNGCCTKTQNWSCGCGHAFYGLGFLGAAWYYISTATGFWMGVFGVLKAIFWPAFLVFKIWVMLGM